MTRSYAPITNLASNGGRCVPNQMARFGGLLPGDDRWVIDVLNAVGFHGSMRSTAARTLRPTTTPRDALALVFHATAIGHFH